MISRIIALFTGPPIDPKSKAGILKAYRRLETKRSGASYKKAYLALKSNLTEAAVYDIIFDFTISAEATLGIYLIFMNGGVPTREKNMHMVGLNRRLRERPEDLSTRLINYLEWLENVHGY